MFDLTSLLCASFSGMFLGLFDSLFQYKPIGVKPFSIVAVGSAAAVLVITGTAGHLEVDSLARVLQAILGGLGFLGAGAILKNDKINIVHGLSSAACLWVAALMGAAFGAHLHSVAFALLGVTCLTLFLGDAINSVFSN